MVAITPICSKATKVLRLCGGGADRTGGLSSEALAGAGLAPTLLCDSFDLLNKVGNSVAKSDRAVQEDSAAHLRLPPGLSLKGAQGESQAAKAARARVERLPRALPEPAYVPLPKDPVHDEADGNVFLKVTEEVLSAVCETTKKVKEDVAGKVPLPGGAAASDDSRLEQQREEPAEAAAARVEGVDISLSDLITLEPRKPKADLGSRQKLRSSAAPFMSALQPPQLLQPGNLGSPQHCSFAGMGAFPNPSTWSDCDAGQFTSAWKGDWQPKDCMSAHLQYLQCSDQRCVLLVQKIHRLGWESAKKLQEHFEWYGPVERVLVAHDKVRVSRRKETTLAQPAQSGFVVMRHFWDAARILAEGHWQKVAENAIEVMPFRSASERF